MKIEEYKKLKRQLAEIKAWRALHGKEYFGGTRGRGGQYATFVGQPKVVGLMIYHQEYDGARNYHECPNALAERIGLLLINTVAGRAFIDNAIVDLEKDLEQVAKEAAAEHAALLTEAGISVQ